METLVVFIGTDQERSAKGSLVISGCHRHRMCIYFDVASIDRSMIHAPHGSSFGEDTRFLDALASHDAERRRGKVG